MIDFTDCKVLKKAYGGANGNKLCIEYDGEKYMLKFPSLPTKKTELSYANGCISEYLACHVYESLGIPVQETVLGTYRKNDKEKIVVACKDFTDVGIVLQDFGSLKNQIIDSEHQGYGTELSDILNAIEKQNSMDSQKIKERFWQMFVADAFLGNFDRHNGNWGFLYNQRTDEIELAPVYDCASCMYPQADRAMIKKVMENEGERHTRVYNFPTSAIKENGRKISYHEFLLTTENMDCKKALSEIYPRIDLVKIRLFIDNMEYIDELQKEFYKTMLKERYERILAPAYEKIQNQLRHEQTNSQEDVFLKRDASRLSEEVSAWHCRGKSR